MSTPLSPLPLIYELIPRVMADIGAVEKNRKNEQQKYQFRGIEDFYQAAHPAFVKHGIFCVPEVLEHAASTFEKTNEYGKVTTWRHVTAKVRHRFFAADGSFVDAVTIGEGLDNSDKATNKAMSGAMKYALIELFSVPTQDVEDSDRTSPETGVQRTAKPIPIPRNPAIVAAQDASGKGPEKVAEPPEGLPAPPQREPASKGLGSLRYASAPPQNLKASITREPGSDDEDDGNFYKPLADAIDKMAGGKSEKPETFLDEPIDLSKQRNLHRTFKDAVRVEMTDTAKANLLRDWLKNQGYIGEDGKGSTKVVPVYLFEEVKANAVKFAETLK